MVIEVSKKFLPNIASQWDNPKVKVGCFAFVALSPASGVGYFALFVCAR